MNASRLPKSTPAAEQPPLEPIPGPVARQRVERRFLGLPARFVLLCLGCAALGVTIGLFATGSWPWGIVTLLLALLFLSALAEAARQGGGFWPEQSGRLAADGRAQASMAAEVWRTRLESSLTRWRTQSQLDQLELERPRLLQTLGDAVHRGDKPAEKEARRQVDELDAQRTRVEAERDERLSRAEERIRLARLPVQETLRVPPPPDPGEPDAE